MDNNLVIFDTTLRDGEQCPGASMTVDQKIEIAKILADLNVDIIEAGFAISSPGEHQAIQRISREVKGPIICSLTRAKREDIDAAVSALQHAERKRIHNFISTSALHMKYKLQMTPDQVLAAIHDSVSYARRFCDDVEWSCEDGTRSDVEFLKRCFDTAIKAGATTVNIADTVGYTMPEEFTYLISTLRSSVEGMEKVRFSVHCHNDLGMAVANSLSAVKAGARQIECTINGLGERAGNTSLEEFVMAMKTRRDVWEAETKIDTTMLTKASSKVSEITGFPIAPNKAIVGSNAFAHESGIHQHGILKNRNTYEIIDPKDVGAHGSTLILGKHSGKHALKARYEELGISMGVEAINRAFEEAKNVSDAGGELNDEALLAIAGVGGKQQQARISIGRLDTVYLEKNKIHVTLHLLINGESFSCTKAATAPIEAYLKAAEELVPAIKNTNLEWSIDVNQSNLFHVVVRMKCLLTGQIFVEENVSDDFLHTFAECHVKCISAWNDELLRG